MRTGILLVLKIVLSTWQTIQICWIKVRKLQNQHPSHFSYKFFSSHYIWKCAKVHLHLFLEIFSMMPHKCSHHTHIFCQLCSHLPSGPSTCSCEITWRSPTANVALGEEWCSVYARYFPGCFLHQTFFVGSFTAAIWVQEGARRWSWAASAQQTPHFLLRCSVYWEWLEALGATLGTSSYWGLSSWGQGKNGYSFLLWLLPASVGHLRVQNLTGYSWRDPSVCLYLLRSVEDTKFVLKGFDSITCFFLLHFLFFPHQTLLFFFQM